MAAFDIAFIAAQYFGLMLDPTMASIPEQIAFVPIGAITLIENGILKGTRGSNRRIRLAEPVWFSYQPSSVYDVRSPCGMVPC